MNAVLATLSPSITEMIRMDHTKVLATFHRYKTDSSPAVKQALVSTACTLIEIHAQLEEEIFYPAMRGADPTVVEKSVPEHEEMRGLILRLRAMSPDDADYDATFMDLMRRVMHHVADEETILLPHAERLLSDRLSELGAQMTRRRLPLMRSHARELVTNRVRTMSYGTMLAGAGALVAGSYMLRNVLRR